MTIRTKDPKEFTKRLQGLARKKRFPVRAMFELTYRCNFRCIHCFNSDSQKMTSPKEELTTADIFKILEQLKDLGCFYLGFTGGEIFVRKDILEILWHAKRCGFQIILLTNGSFIDESIADELSRLMPNKIDITVHAMNYNIFDRISQVAGSAEKIFGAIRLLHKRNLPLGLKSCGMQENKEEIAAISRFSRSLDAIYRFDGELLPRSDRTKTPLEYSISLEEAYSLRRECYPEMFTKYDEKGRLRKMAKPHRRNLKRLFNCGAGYTDVTITPFGELKTCIEIDYPKYKILDGRLSEGWKKIRDFVDNLKPPMGWACRSCKFRQYCSWCPARGYLEDGNFSTCDSYTRTQAEFIKQIYKTEV